MSADTNKDWTPVELIENNIKSFRLQASAHRADCERSAFKAHEADKRADIWQETLDKLKS